MLAKVESALLGALLGAAVGVVGKYGIPVTTWWPVWLCGIAGLVVGLGLALFWRRPA